MAGTRERVGRWRSAAASAAGLCALAAGLAQAHEGTPPIPFGSEALPAFVVPENGAPAPAGSPATALVVASLDDVDPRLAYRIYLFGLDLATEVESVHLQIGEPGTNGPHVLNVWGASGQDDSDLVVSLPASFMAGIWDDGDESLGPDGERDPLESVALSSVVDEVLLGELYVTVTTFDYPLPDTAELRGQIAIRPQRGAILGCEDGHLGTGAEGEPPVADVRVFKALTAIRPSMGGRWTDDPHLFSSPAPPGLAPVGAGEVHLDALVEPSTGQNLSYWDGLGPVRFGAVPGSEQLVIGDGVSGMVLDGGSEPVAGFALGTTAPDGGGLAADLDYVLSARPDPPAAGVYLAALRLRQEDASIPVSPSPRIFAVLGASVGLATLDTAVAWVESHLDLPDCQDGYDNEDGDLDPDLSDGGCATTADASEFELSIGCDNGIDDDGDGAIDYPADPECRSALQLVELPEPASRSGMAFAILALAGLARRVGASRARAARRAGQAPAGRPSLRDFCALRAKKRREGAPSRHRRSELADEQELSGSVEPSSGIDRSPAGPDRAPRSAEEGVLVPAQHAGRAAADLRRDVVVDLEGVLARLAREQHELDDREPVAARVLRAQRALASPRDPGPG